VRERLSASSHLNKLRRYTVVNDYIVTPAESMILAGLTLYRSTGASEISVLLVSTHCIHSFSISDYSLIYYFALWFALVALSAIFLFIRGLDYHNVTWPSLLPLTEAIHYIGRGFRSGYHWAVFGVGKRPLVLRPVGPCDHSQDVPQADYGFYHARFPVFLAFPCS
jgi:hypothetical protein